MVLVIFKAKVVPVEAQLVQTSIWLLLINTINLQFCHLIFMEILISDLIKLDKCGFLDIAELQCCAFSN